MTEYAELEINFERQGIDRFAVAFRFSLPDSDVERRGKVEGHHIAVDELRQLVTDPAAYGRCLGHDLFQVAGVREVFAVTKSRGVDLRFRLGMAPSDADVHGLRWETLADPDAPLLGAPLLMSERILFSRYVDSSDWRPVTSRAKRDVRALVVVANPRNLDRYRLAAVDVPGEITRARDGMTGIHMTEVLGERDRASRKNIVDRLRTSPDILYLVCHGALVEGKSVLWLENDDGTSDLRAGHELVSWLGELKQPPRLVVLVSCQGAGRGEGTAADAAATAKQEAWNALGPRLGASGVPAVLAMHGNVTMATIDLFMPTFFHELQQHGIVDRAVAIARGAVRDRPDAWAPVLYMRLKSGRLWFTPGVVIPIPRPGPLNTPSRLPHNLPLHPTPFVGREREVAEIAGLLLRPDVRLVTLTGPGGVGKTRLGTRVAAESLESFPDGAFLVDLARLTDPDLVPSATATVLGLREQPGQSLEQTLAEYLRERHLLLLCDNFEHVLPAATFVAELLAAAPGVKVLVTSRARLGLQAEHEYRVEALPLPDLSALRPGEVSLAAAQGSPAVQLFLECTWAFKFEFTLTADNAPMVAEIVSQLDGLPLAIELAAARVKLLSPAALRDRLRRRLSTLTGGARDLPARQQTLRDTIAWSHDLLAPQEQILFRRLSVFVGGWTLEAAEAISAVDAGEMVDAFQAMASLADQSLVDAWPTPEALADEPRYGMLETIREFASEQLAASGELETVERAFEEFLMQRAEAAAEGLHGPDQLLWLERLEVEHDNLRAAMGRALERGDGAVALRLALRLWEFWESRGFCREGRAWLERILALGGPVDERDRAAAEFALGRLSFDLGDYDAAELRYLKSLEARRQLGDTIAEAEALSALAMIAINRLAYEEANRLGEEALSIARQSNDRRSTASTLLVLGIIACEQGDYARGLGFFEESLALGRALGDTVWTARIASQIGITHRLAGNADQAQHFLDMSRDLHDELGDRLALAVIANNSGHLAVDAGDVDRAIALYGDALWHIDAVRDLVLRRDVGGKSAVIESLEGLAGLACVQGDAARGVLLFGASDALRLALGMAMPPPYSAERDRLLATARGVLEDAAFTMAWNRGRALSLHEAVAEALAPHHPR